MILEKQLTNIKLPLSKSWSAFFLAISTVLFGGITSAYANLDGMKSSLDTAGASLKPATGSSGTYIPVIVGNLINYVLAMIGVLLLVYLIYAGFLWMTAGGDEGKVKTATAMIRNSIIGLLIIVASFVIADFVLGALIAGLGGGTVSSL